MDYIATYFKNNFAIKINKMQGKLAKRVSFGPCIKDYEIDPVSCALNLIFWVLLIVAYCIIDIFALIIVLANHKELSVMPIVYTNIALVTITLLNSVRIIPPHRPFKIFAKLVKSEYSDIDIQLRVQLVVFKTFYCESFVLDYKIRDDDLKDVPNIINDLDEYILKLLKGRSFKTSPGLKIDDINAKIKNINSVDNVFKD